MTRSQRQPWHLLLSDSEVVHQLHLALWVLHFASFRISLSENFIGRLEAVTCVKHPPVFIRFFVFDRRNAYIYTHTQAVCLINVNINWFFKSLSVSYHLICYLREPQSDGHRK